MGRKLVAFDCSIAKFSQRGPLALNLAPRTALQNLVSLSVELQNPEKFKLSEFCRVNLFNTKRL
jgi:hypothetical protein